MAVFAVILARELQVIAAPAGADRMTALLRWRRDLHHPSGELNPTIIAGVHLTRQILGALTLFQAVGIAGLAPLG